MGRKRGFDESEVVALAGTTFRANGYEATSVDDLVESTGLHRGSLYGAFGSKRGLFIHALTRAGASAPTTDAAIDLILVALLELAPIDGEVRAIVGRHLSSMPDADVAVTLGTRLLARAGVERFRISSERNTP